MLGKCHNHRTTHRWTDGQSVTDGWNLTRALVNLKNWASNRVGLKVQSKNKRYKTTNFFQMKIIRAKNFQKKLFSYQMELECYHSENIARNKTIWPCYNSTCMKHVF